MEQDNISKKIKEIRTKKGLSQQEFASIYGVTYQAVSKWETGKNIPDITILQKIASDNGMDLDELISNRKKKEKSKWYIFLIICILILGGINVLIYNTNKDDDFVLKSLTTTCQDFNIYGSIAYNDKKSSIHISNITYCGEKENTKYSNFKCTLYEVNDSGKLRVSDYSYDDEPVSIEDFLKLVDFKVDNYVQACENIDEANFQIEVEASNGDEQKFYKIPLIRKDC